MADIFKKQKFTSRVLVTYCEKRGEEGGVQSLLDFNKKCFKENLWAQNIALK